MYSECKFPMCFKINKILWRLSLKIQLEGLSYLCRLPDIKIAWINPWQPSFLQSFKSGSPSALMFAIIKQSHLLLIKYLNHHIEPILTEKISITIGDINSWNKTKYKFSNLSLKTWSPNKIKKVYPLLKKCIENY